MTRRLLVFGVFAALSQLASGCYCWRSCVAQRWHYFHGGAGCAGGACTPAFRIPTPVALPGPAPGCTSCAAPAPLPGPVVYGGPIGAAPPIGYGPPAGVPTFSAPMPLGPGGPTVDPGASIPSPLPPPKAAN